MLIAVPASAFPPQAHRPADLGCLAIFLP